MSLHLEIYMFACIQILVKEKKKIIFFFFYLKLEYNEIVLKCM